MFGLSIIPISNKVIKVEQLAIDMGTFHNERSPRRKLRHKPAIISHGANSTREDRSRFLLEFDWPGTFDPTAWLSVPEALRFIPSLVEGGWPEVMRRNHALALQARDILCDALDVAHPAPDIMLGSMAAIPLPDSDATTAPSLYGDPLQDALLFEEKIEVPIVPWPRPGNRVLRVSAQLYNDEGQYVRLAALLREAMHAG